MENPEKKSRTSRAWAWFKCRPTAVKIMVAWMPPLAAGLLWLLWQPSNPALVSLAMDVLKTGVRSLPVMAAIGMALGLATALLWNIPNSFRRDCSDVLLGLKAGNPWGALALLALEVVGVLALLALILVAMVLWPEGPGLVVAG